MDEDCREIGRRLEAGDFAALCDDEAAQRHLRECPRCWERLEALERDAEADPTPRRSRLRSIAALTGVIVLSVALVGAWMMLRARASPHPHGHRSGLEGPSAIATPTMQREAAANAGILGRRGSRHRDDEDGHMARDEQALGALMGDVIGSIGIGGLSARGRGGGVGYGSIGNGALPSKEKSSAHRSADERERDGKRAHWQMRQPLERAPLAAALPPLAAGRRTLVLPGPDAFADPATTSPPPSSAAEQFLALHRDLKGVRFIDPNAYFANTYVPGDPELRVLQARLRDTSSLPEGVRSARPDDAARAVAQPFDAPEQAALALYVSASETGITSARRMLLQVGLQATPRYSGRRPAMNVGIVVDARAPLETTALENVRALLAAFADARDANDRMTLLAAGPGGGALINPDAFRLGSVSVALQRLQIERERASVSLPDAMRAALQELHGGDDPLGSSAMIVITPCALDAELAVLERVAHESALEGVPVSVVGVSNKADPEQLSRLALSGQGNRRLLTAAADAAQLVDRELSAVARVVARALRLRIHLAAGVHLVSVLGSHPLDQPHAERVREAENSIDQHVRRDLGIVQDRGDDEEGVQIVIPSFDAGDSHVVLLDVVAQGPGAIADVSVRYKDLVQLGNGSARASLWLSNLELARGPLQHNVLENLVAFELAERLRSAGDVLARGGDGAARELLDRALALLDSLPAALPDWHGDRELASDRALAAQYLSLLAHIEQPAQRAFLVDSLHFASRLKLQPRSRLD